MMVADFMPAKDAARLLHKLEKARTQIRVIPEEEFSRLLARIDRVALGTDTKSLIRFHERVLVLRAFPAGPRAAKSADAVLGRFESRIKTALAAGAEPDDFGPEEVAGIAGTVVEGTFSYAMVCWLVERFAGAI